jgi:hypothetical protein
LHAAPTEATLGARWEALVHHFRRCRALLSMLLVVALITMGCGVAPHRSFEDGTRVAQGPTKGDGAHKTHGHGDADAAFLILGCVLIVFTVVIDVIILPCTIPNDRPFCCTEEVVVVCFR